MSDKELMKIVKGFTKGILGGSANDGQCYVVSAPLCGYLNFIGVKADLLECFIGASENAFYHWVILLSDGRIIDATASQFNHLVTNKMPPIYIGERPDYYNLLTPQTNK